MPEGTDAVISAVYRSEWGRILATLIRITGNFDLAEEATQLAFETAVTRWRGEGVPDNPRAWLIQTARNAAIDRVRRQKALAQKLDDYAAELDLGTPEQSLPTEIPDDRLRLIFTCCHPAIALEAQVALTLRTLVGLETQEIARAFVTPETAMAQRIVRAKKKIGAAKIPYIVPETSEMAERLHAVLVVLYLVFTEGYAATRGASLLRTDLSAEAIRLARVLHGLMGPVPPAELTGVLALMLLHDSRREARVDAQGDVVVLDEQDRSRWHQPQISEALALLDSLASDPGPFALQAQIAAVHARARRKEDTDWAEIVRIYDRLQEIEPSPIVALNRAAAVAMHEGPARALELLQELAQDLDGYHLFHAARADLERRLRAFDRAEKSYLRALTLVGNESERRFLERRLNEVRASGRAS
jgi:RNA polymerase sigma-70 factor (ECF subfamily)